MRRKRSDAGNFSATRALTELPVFELFPDKVRQLSMFVRATHVKAFSKIIEKGDHLNHVVISIAGTRAEVPTGLLGRSVQVEPVPPGYVIDQIEAGRPIPFSISSDVSTWVLSIEAEPYKRILNQDPTVAKAFSLINNCQSLQRFASRLLAEKVNRDKIIETIVQTQDITFYPANKQIGVNESGIFFPIEGRVAVVNSRLGSVSAPLNLGPTDWFGCSTLRKNYSKNWTARTIRPSYFHFLPVEALFKSELSGLVGRLEEPWEEKNPDGNSEASGKKSYIASHSEKLPRSWLSKNGYSIVLERLTFSRDGLDDLECMFSNLSLLLKIGIKFERLFFAQHMHRGISKIAEALERNGLMTRAISISYTEICRQKMPLLAICEGSPVLVLAANSDGVVLLHSKLEIVFVAKRDFELIWDNRCLSVQVSEFEETLDIARRQNFIQNRVLVGNQGIKRLMSKEWKFFWNLIAFGVFAGLVEALLPIFVHQVVDRVIGIKDFESMTSYISAVILALVLIALAQFFRSYITIRQMMALNLKVRSTFFKYMLQAPSSIYGEAMACDIVIRMPLIERVFASACIVRTQRISCLCLGVLNLLLLMYLSVPIGAVAAFGSVLIVFVRRQNMGQIVQEAHGIMESKRKLRWRITEQILGHSTIKSYLKEDVFIGRTEECYFDHQRAQTKIGWMVLNGDNLTAAVVAVVACISLALLANQILNGNVTIGQFFATMMLLNHFWRPASEFGMIEGQTRFMEMEAGVIAEYLRITDYSYLSAKDSQYKQLIGKIEFDNVFYRYDGASAVSLHGVGFGVGQGQILAIVGRSGSGKSTIGRLMAGLVQPSSGRILYDGVDARTISPLSIRDQVGYVSQKSVLFSGTILSNIALGDDHPDLERVREVAQMAGALDFIESLPAGHRYIIGEDGTGLSGGQKMQICIARALYRNTKILVLDEPAAHLDPRMVQRIFENLRGLSEPKTLIVITQRLSAVSHADRILVMKNGHLVEGGPHKDLIRADMEYSELYLSQLNAY